MPSVIHFLGTCSGTEPMLGAHHCSWILETAGYYYWFDAGENCAYQAHTSGLDLTRIRTLMISHPHIDHIGGLPNLLFCLNKIKKVYQKDLICQNTLEIFFSDTKLLEAAKLLATNSRPSSFSYRILEHGLKDGLIYEDENVRIHALHNEHLPKTENGFSSFSFLIEADSERIIYSGDVRSPKEMDPFMEEGCDRLIMETGHHSVSDVCEYAISKKVKHVYFNHHGRQILNHPKESKALMEDYENQSNTAFHLCFDGMNEPFGT